MVGLSGDDVLTWLEILGWNTIKSEHSFQPNNAIAFPFSLRTSPLIFTINPFVLHQSHNIFRINSQTLDSIPPMNVEQIPHSPSPSFTPMNTIAFILNKFTGYIHHVSLGCYCT